MVPKGNGPILYIWSIQPCDVHQVWPVNFVKFFCMAAVHSESIPVCLAHECRGDFGRFLANLSFTKGLTGQPYYSEALVRIASIRRPGLYVHAMDAIGLVHLVSDLCIDAQVDTENCGFFRWDLGHALGHELSVPNINDLCLLKSTKGLLLHQTSDWAFDKV